LPFAIYKAQLFLVFFKASIHTQRDTDIYLRPLLPGVVGRC
jgi:hypothetical protein